MSLSEVMAEVVCAHTKLQEGISWRQKENASGNHSFLLWDFLDLLWSFGNSCCWREDGMLGCRFDPEFVYFFSVNIRDSEELKRGLLFSAVIFFSTFPLHVSLMTCSTVDSLVVHSVVISPEALWRTQPFFLSEFHYFSRVQNARSSGLECEHMLLSQ